MPNSHDLSNFRCIVLTPPGQADPSIAIAASRGGDLGVLDLEYVTDVRRAEAAIGRLVQFAKGRCGLKVHSGAAAAARLISDLPEAIETVILSPAMPDVLRSLVELVQGQGRDVWLEATSIEEAELGRQAGVDGLIAKGHEAGGRVGEETTFILLQRLLDHADLPIWAQGGIGLHTVGACYAAGASGVVLDAQLYLARESTLPERAKEVIGRMDGSETACPGSKASGFVRVYARSRLAPVEALRGFGRGAMPDETGAESRAGWHQRIADAVGWDSEEKDLWLVGQDGAFAAGLAARFRTVAGILDGMRRAVVEHVDLARRQLALGEHAPLARAHGTRYPIVQGPMTRVSDRPAFAYQVAQGGGLPFLALALMRGPEVGQLLEETREKLGEMPWGVGILGFVPRDLRQEQMEFIRKVRPAFALIAGGRPDQAQALEQDGIATYLHVPSPELLKLFLANGARRFVFEGRECGGHVGPRSSFVLWDTMVSVLLESLGASDIAACHILFAGGIHDARSAAMVATLAAPAVERGAKIGVLLGTAYLFTEEAVASGAITRQFQQEAVQCDQTVLLESGPGHATRCAETPFVRMFEAEKARLAATGMAQEEMREALERLNIGRLRIAAKGADRHPKYGEDAEAPKLVPLADAEQYERGMYMIGQVAALRRDVCTIAELHDTLAVEGMKRLIELAAPIALDARLSATQPEQPFDVAIVGMACLLPKAPDLAQYWSNILNKVDAIGEVPADRWEWQRYFDPDPAAVDKVYSKWGGFLDDVAFDPLRYGMPPSSLAAIEPLQLLTLEVVRAALQDAGYLERPFARGRAAVILGAGGGVATLGNQYAVRAALPSLVPDVTPDMLAQLPTWTEDSFPGILLNVAAGRVANRFDLGGVNYVVDAACASSLAAVYLACRELSAGTSDLAIVGGVDTVQNPFAYLCFSKTHALSAAGRCRTFDAEADGIVISEGLAMLVLKRRVDAERDGDRIYAVIQGAAGSSDGRDKSLTAPRPEGQALALTRAYAQAGCSPASVELIEAHGTGTVVGDQTEVATLKQVFGAAGAGRQQCAIGSAKSMIGHTKCAAGVAGLIKAALALHHKILPPTLHVEKPNPAADFANSPFYINTDARPWIHDDSAGPRRAGVSAFGFGGTNFHVVLEEYTDGYPSLNERAAGAAWPSELLLWRAGERAALLQEVERVAGALARGATPRLSDLSYRLWQQARGQTGLTLAIVAASIEELRPKLDAAMDALRSEKAPLQDPRGIYLGETQPTAERKVAFLFPGQGSQYPHMLADLALHFSEVRAAFEQADRALAERLAQPLSRFIFPPSAFTPEERTAHQNALMQTTIAQPALGAAEIGLARLLGALGVQPDMVGGHSYGEYVALCSAGVIEEDALYRLSEARGRCIVEAAGEEAGGMAAVLADPAQAQAALASVDGVWVANLNGPRQTVIAGTQEGIAQAIERLEQEGIQARRLPVACGFHSPLVAPAAERLAQVLATVDFQPPRWPVFSNTSAQAYPAERGAIADLLTRQLTRPVRFVEEVEAMYEAGARVFVEVGPRAVLTGLTSQILGERPHHAVALDLPERAGLLQLHHALGQMAAGGVDVDLDRLFEGREARRIRLDALKADEGAKALPATTWLVNGARARPLHEDGRARVTAETAHAAHGNSNGDGPPSATRAPVAQAEASNKGAGRTRPLVSSSQNAGAETNGAGRAAARPVAHAQGAAPKGGDVDEVFLHFQRQMSKYLETQRQVMLAYLGHHPAPSVAGPGDVGGQNGSVPAVAGPAVTGPAVAGQNGPEIGVPSGRGVVDESHANGANGAGAGAAVEDARPDPVRAPIREEQITQALLQIVSERTGYPPTMLDLDLNLEADLGIDSIKRVEILGTYQRTHLTLRPEQAQEAMEQLTRAKTLRAIVGIVRGLADAPVDVPPVDAGQATAPVDEPVGEAPVAERDGPVAVPRFRMRAVAKPMEAQARLQRADGVLVVTDDERGIAEAFVRLVRAEGVRAVRVRMSAGDFAEGGAGWQEADEGVYAAHLTDADAAAALVAALTARYGALAGIVHLLPLKAGLAFDAMALADWQARLDLEAKSLYALARAMSSELRRANPGGARWVVAATALGGGFGGDGHGPQTFLPSQGAVAGLVKSLAKEWPQVTHKVIDLAADVDAEMDPGQMAAWLVDEMNGGDETVEVGYRDGQRWALEAEAAPHAMAATGAAMANETLDANSVVLITGGARGITAVVARELVERYRPTLILVGRAAMPPMEEAAQTARFETPKELKAALIEQMGQAGQSVTPARVEQAYAELLRAREIRRNLEALRRSGATVQYESLDVRDERAFGGLIERLYATYGRIDGVIHGAGVIEDKLIEEKQPESFDRVLGTKAISAFILSRYLRPETLRFLVFFSSVAGRFGNRGQSDYAAANEVLNKMALYLDRRWAGRVVSINWGPWVQAGMVSPQVRQQFEARGIQMIAPAPGAAVVDDELRYGHKHDVEIVFGDGPWGSDTQEDGARSALPLLAGIPRRRTGDDAGEVVIRLDPAKHLYLRDHRLDGKPVLPAAMALEAMAETVQQRWPQWEIGAVHGLRVLKGIVLEQGAKTVRVRFRLASQDLAHQAGATRRVEAEIVDDATQQSYYRATVELVRALPEAPRHGLPSEDSLRAYPLSVEAAYAQRLFHGPVFQCIREIRGMSEREMVATVLPSQPQPCLADASGDPWLIDPVVVDSGPQLAILWARAYHDMTALPSGFRTYRRYGALAGEPLVCHFQVLPESNGPLLYADVTFVRGDGRVAGVIERLESTASASFNRLAGVFAEAIRGSL